MLGAALVLCAFAAGWVLGARRVPKPDPVQPAERERAQLLAEQQAFRELMCYSPEIAYGAAADGEG